MEAKDCLRPISSRTFRPCDPEYSGFRIRMEGMDNEFQPQAMTANAGMDGPAPEPGAAASRKMPDPMSILDQASDAVIVFGLDGEVLYWNRAAERLFEWPASEAMRRHAQDFLWADSHSGDDALAGVLANGAWNGEMAVVKKSGGRFLVESRWSLLRGDDARSRTILTIHFNVREKTARDEQLASVQQLENVAAFERGFVHDLNNVFGPILMAADLFKHTVRSQRELDLLETVRVSARNGSEIVKRMLSISRGSNRATGADSKVQAVGEADELPRGHGELILLIDDEAPMRLIAGRTLETHGYQVVTACDGAEGVAKYSARRGDFALVITDMIMPVMDGSKTVRTLMALDPSVKVIASTGENMKDAEEEAIQNGVKWFLRKPYTAATLLATLEEALRPRESA
jgi:PAS domain S-box-containing protein